MNGIGLIAWKYIEGFEIKKGINATFLVIKVSDTEELLSSVNRVSRILMKSNIKRLGSPVAIPQSEFHEPLQLVKEVIEAYKSSL